MLKIKTNFFSSGKAHKILYKFTKMCSFPLLFSFLWIFLIIYSLDVYTRSLNKNMLSFVMWIDLLVKFFMEDMKDYNIKDWKKNLDLLFWWLILHFYHSFVNVIWSLSFCKQRHDKLLIYLCFTVVFSERIPKKHWEVDVWSDSASW